MKKILLLCSIITIIFITACSKENEDLKTILSEDNYIVVDVRTKEEYDEGHIVDSINIPYDEIAANKELDKTKTILVYCKSGIRSNKAYNTLKELGYDVYDLGAYDSIKLLDKE